MPEQIGSAPITGPVTTKADPQEFITDGGVGTTCASDIQATVEAPFGGSDESRWSNRISIHPIRCRSRTIRVRPGIRLCS